MIITVAAFKGGVGKTTTAVHLAGALAETGKPTLLVDLDYNRSSLGWAAPGHLPFRTVDLEEGRKLLSEYRNGHVVLDTPARPDRDEFQELAQRGDVLVVPTTPDALAVRALTQTVQMLEEASSRPFKVLLTIVPPYPTTEGERARRALSSAGLDLFRAQVPRTVAFHRAAMQGRLVHEVRSSKSMTAWSAYVDAAEELTG